MRKRSECIICKAWGLPLDASGRCGSCAAVLRAKGSNLSYGNLIAAEGRPTPVKEIEGYGKYVITCAECGKQFRWDDKRQKYCCDACKDRSQYRRQRERKARNG